MLRSFVICKGIILESSKFLVRVSQCQWMLYLSVRSCFTAAEPAADGDTIDKFRQSQQCEFRSKFRSKFFGRYRGHFGNSLAMEPASRITRFGTSAQDSNGIGYAGYASLLPNKRTCCDRMIVYCEVDDACRFLHFEHQFYLQLCKASWPAETGLTWKSLGTQSLGYLGSLSAQLLPAERLRKTVHKQVRTKMNSMKRQARSNVY